MTWLENLAKTSQQKFYLLASLCVTAVAAFILIDPQLQWLGQAIPFVRIDKIGKRIGKAAYLLGFVAIFYYVIRESFVMARKMKAPIPARLDAATKTLIAVLRLSHPLLGVLAFSLGLLHGYVMWKVWTAATFDFAMNTGLVAVASLVIVSFSGLLIRWMPKLIKLRYLHRLVGILFVLSFVFHRIVAD